MPARQHVQRLPTPDIQGDDSWVEISRPTVGDIEELMAELPDDSLNGTDKTQNILSNLAATKRLISKHVLDWNWVDDNGAALDIPTEHPDIISQLTDAEMLFLVQALTYDANKLKKTR